MPKEFPTEVVQPMGDHNDPSPCIRSEHIKDYLDFKHEFLNPLQSKFLPYLEDHDTNVVIAAPTSSGKTVCIELFIAEAIENHKKTALYIAPMKALADEKYEEWTSSEHTFSKYSIEIQTGDFELTEGKKKKLLAADIIILTPEMFNSKCRFYDQHNWLHNSVFVGDEIHLIGMKDRGDALEVGLIQYFENNHKARALFVSATIPNVNDFNVWLQHMTGRNSVYIKSDYRPCRLNKKFVSVPDINDSGRGMTYAMIEIKRQEEVIKEVKKHKDHPIIIFVGSKDFGYKITRQLNSLGIEAHFHNADLKRENRKVIESGFRNLDFKVLVSTTTNAWGVNLPARYVIISHTAFGLTPMEPANIHQSMGRAGRAGYADEGDAIIMVRRKDLQREKVRIFSNYKVNSTLNNVNTLCFHILSYIVNKGIKDKKELLHWYGQTLASIQNNEINEDNAQKVLDLLAGRGMIKFDKSENHYVATKMGEITARMYMSPLDVSDWFKNFSRIKLINPPRGTEDTTVGDKINTHVALCFAECYNWGCTWFNENKSNSNTSYISKREENCIDVMDFSRRVGKAAKDNPHLKYAACFYKILKGEDPSPEIASYGYAITKDCDRIVQTMRMLDDQVGKYAKSKSICQGYGWGAQWDVLLARLKYGVKSDMIELVSIDGIGRSYAKKLYNIGIKTKADIKSTSNRSKIEKVLGKKRSDKILELI